MNTKHTPGPWEYDRNAGHIVAQGISVCRISACSGYGEHDDNARLIAAAPELADALAWALEQIEDDLDPYHQQALAHARAVLAQALGEA